MWYFGRWAGAIVSLNELMKPINSRFKGDPRMIYQLIEHPPPPPHTHTHPEKSLILGVLQSTRQQANRLRIEFISRYSRITCMNLALAALPWSQAVCLDLPSLISPHPPRHRCPCILHRSIEDAYLTFVCPKHSSRNPLTWNLKSLSHRHLISSFRPLCFHLVL